MGGHACKKSRELQYANDTSIGHKYRATIAFVYLHSVFLSWAYHIEYRRQIKVFFTFSHIKVVWNIAF